MQTNPYEVDVEADRPFAESGPHLDPGTSRYTAYPGVERFVDAFGPAEYAAALRQRAEGATVGGRAPLTIAVQVPFCESACHFCACHKVVTRRREPARAYVDAVEREIELHHAALGARERVSEVHLAGGTPTVLVDEDLARLLEALRTGFRLEADAEIALRLHPNTVSPERLATLVELGIRRVSLGVQDFDPEVQHALHRFQSLEAVAALVSAARALGLRSTQVDLVYGLPRQTAASWARTVGHVAALRPDRVTLLAYVHLPQRYKGQRRLDAATLPDARERAAMLESAQQQFGLAGYEAVGMDEFALPGDSWAQARRQGRLHRSLRGCDTRPDGDMIGLGVAAIGRIGATYAQNARTLETYHDALAQGRFATERGLALTRDDLVRRAVIMALLCQGRVEIESIESAYLLDFGAYFAEQLDALAAFARAGRVELDHEAIQLTPAGMRQARAIAAVFDRHRMSDARRELFAHVI